MSTRRLTPADLAGKVIDVHSHVGVALKSYAALEYPWAQTVEDVYYRQLAGGVDVNVVFPFTGDLHFEPGPLVRGEMVPAAEPVSPVPYAVENRRVVKDVYDHCPEIADRFLPFVCIDPVREAAGQLAELRALADEYPVYGMKVNPVGCQSHAAGLLGEGSALLDFAEERDLPLLFHVSTLPGEDYSQAADVLAITEARPKLRFCLAHCILFDRVLLDRAAAAPNVWVDTAAMKIQVQLVREELPPGGLIDADFSDHLAVMRALCGMYPRMILWGTDSPCYSYICCRKQGEGAHHEFRLKATYADEVAALECLPPELKSRVSNLNTLEFLFGGGGGAG